ncbi:hypothetical protein RchiOBHm_Chr5g0014181 [Rosa chinensis]|uniref:Uncharacterized protein n=1 Tax=Rosa chinensis TaxID=74649 RepID=A0A2P6Q5K7_ROSCH|nr:hypothetical protein RchiOBHm_Chr5g0014181 [Rosa chinensis]
MCRRVYLVLNSVLEGKRELNFEKFLFGSASLLLLSTRFSCASDQLETSVVFGYSEYQSPKYMHLVSGSDRL